MRNMGYIIRIDHPGLAEIHALDEWSQKVGPHFAPNIWNHPAQSYFSPTVLIPHVISLIGHRNLC